MRQVKTKFFIACLILIGIIIFSKIFLVFAEEEENEYPILGGEETTLVTLDDGIYYFDAEITSLDNNLSSSNFRLSVWKYTLGGTSPEGIWEKLEIRNQPLLRSGYARAVINNKVYFYGGYTKDEDGNFFISDSLFEFDPILKSFQHIQPGEISAPPMVDGLGLNYKDDFYISGGVNDVGLPINDIWKFDEQSRIWNKLPLNISTSIQNLDTDAFLPIIFESDENIYLLGKTNGFPEFELWEFDHISLAVKKRADLLLPEYRDEIAYTNIDGKFYLFGGRNEDNQFFADLWIFENGQFTKFQSTSGNEPAPTPRAGAKLTMYNDHLFLFGGYNDAENETYNYQVWEFNPDTTKWIDRSFTVQGLGVPTPPGYDPNIISIPGIFTNDVVVRDTDRGIRTESNYNLGKVRCSPTKKKRIKISGSSVSQFIWKYGGPNRYNITINPYQIAPITKDNHLFLSAGINPLSGMTIFGIYWQVENFEYQNGKLFKGFNDDFFQTFIEPLPTMTVGPGHSYTQPIVLNDAGLNKPVLSRGRDIKKWEKNDNIIANIKKVFPPGRHRVHLLAVGYDENEYFNAIGYRMNKGLRARVCGRTRNVPPELKGFYGPVDYIPLHYSAVVWDFTVPEIENIPDVLEINENAGYLQDGSLNIDWGMEGTQFNSMRPIFYGHMALQNSQLIPLIGHLDKQKASNYTPILNDNPFYELNNGNPFNTQEEFIQALHKGTPSRFSIFTDDKGKFSFQIFNPLPYTSDGLDIPGVPDDYTLKFLVQDNAGNIIGTPPVKIQITNDLLPLQIFNYKDGDKTVTIKPVIQASYKPHREFYVSVNSGRKMLLKTNYEGNIIFVLQDNLKTGNNEIQFTDSIDSTVNSVFHLDYNPNHADIPPKIVSHLSGNYFFSNYPVFLGNYIPGTDSEETVVGYQFDNGEVKGARTDESGHFHININEALPGTIDDSDNGGIHSLRVFDEDKSQTIYFRIFEKYLPLPEGTDFTFEKKGDAIKLIEGGRIRINKNFDIFVHAGNSVEILAPELQINVPAGVNIYKADSGHSQLVIKGGYYDVKENDQIVMGRINGKIWLENDDNMEIEIPPNTTIIAKTANASFTYIDQGEIYTIDPISYNGNKIELMNVKDYFYLPLYKPVQVFNYVNGQEIDTVFPIFEGESLPNSYVELWMKKRVIDGVEEEKERLIGKAITDYFGRFHIQISENLEKGGIYEFTFFNRSSQSPAMRYMFRVKKDATEEKKPRTYNPVIHGDIEIKHEYRLIKKMPLRWEERAM